MKIKVPTDADGLKALLSNPLDLKQIFSLEGVADGTAREVMDAYAKEYGARNKDTSTEMRDQVQSILFDFVRDNGGGRRPNLDLSNMVTFEGGRPRLQLTGDGSPSVSKGRGAVYNRAAPGAVFEQKYRPEDRFASIGEYCQAIREEGRPSSRPNRKELLANVGRTLALAGGIMAQGSLQQALSGAAAPSQVSASVGGASQPQLPNGNSTSPAGTGGSNSTAPSQSGSLLLTSPPTSNSTRGHDDDGGYGDD